MAKQESTGPGGDGLRATASQFRTAAGLGERKSDKPTDVTRHEKGGGRDAEELKVTGPAKAGVEDKTQTSKAKAVKAAPAKKKAEKKDEK